MSLRARTGGEAAEAGPDQGLASIPEGAESSLASDAVVYAGATYIAQLLTLIANLAQRGILGPENTGYWTLMGTAWSLFAIASFGVVDGAVRQIPDYRGRRQFRPAAEAADTAFTVSVCGMSLAGAALITVSLLFGRSWEPELQWGLILVGALAPIRALVDAHDMLLQATKRFRPLSHGLIARAAAALLVQTGLVVMFGYYGMFAGLLAAQAAVLVVWARAGLAGFRRPAFRWGFYAAKFRELVRIGIPLFLFGYLWLLFFATDSLIVAGFVGVRELGYYALALSITNYVLLLPRSISHTMFPRMQERFAAQGDKQAIEVFTGTGQLVLAWVLVPPLIVLGFFALPVLVRNVLPSFEPAIATVHIMAAGSFLIALVDLPIQAQITTGHRWRLTALMVVALAVNAAANYVAVAVLGAGIEGAAIATVLTYGLLLVVLTLLSQREGGTAAWRHLGMIAAMVAWTLAVVWGVETLFPPAPTGWLADIALALAKIVICLAALAPWIVAAERHYPTVGTLREMARARLSARAARR